MSSSQRKCGDDAGDSSAGDAPALGSPAAPATVVAGATSPLPAAQHPGNLALGIEPIHADQLVVIGNSELPGLKAEQSLAAPIARVTPQAVPPDQPKQEQQQQQGELPPGQSSQPPPQQQQQQQQQEQEQGQRQQQPLAPSPAVQQHPQQHHASGQQQQLQCDPVPPQATPYFTLSRAVAKRGRGRGGGGCVGPRLSLAAEFESGLAAMTSAAGQPGVAAPAAAGPP
ncbi:hypothetical protein MNEG_15245, partial [Monoraphidium neglectum]